MTLERADMALYGAKRDGRDCTRAFMHISSRSA